MRKVLGLVVALAAVGCTPTHEVPVDSEGRPKGTLREVCMNGVVYYAAPGANGTSSYAVKYTASGTIEFCQ